MEPEELEQEEPNIEEILKTSTLPSGLQSHICGNFSSEAEARELLNTVVAWLKYMGTFLDLERLEGVTIADDYVRALSEVERGFETQYAPTPTNDEFGTGFAMCLPVIRKGKLNSHIVFNTAIVLPLLDDSHPLFKTSLHNLCHEAAHAHDHKLQDEAFPGVYGKPYRDFRESIFLGTAKGAWEEYAAQRLSARMGTPDNYEETICLMLRSARERGNTSIDQFYSVHHDASKTANEMIAAYGTLFIRSSYLVGQAHGEGKTVEEAAPELSRLIRETPWFAPLFDAYVQCLTELYDSYGGWPGIQVFDKFIHAVECLYYRGGMTIKKKPDGHYFVGLQRQ